MIFAFSLIALFVLFAVLDSVWGRQWYETPSRDCRVTITTGYGDFRTGEYKPSHIFIEFWNGDKFVSDDCQHWEKL